MTTTSASTWRSKGPKTCWVALLLWGGLAGCAGDGAVPREKWPADLRIASLAPVAVVRESTLEVHGAGLVTDVLGTTRLHLAGSFAPDGGGEAVDVDAAFLVAVASAEEASASLAQGAFAQICPGGSGTFTGTAWLEVASRATGVVYETDAIGAGLLCRQSFEPVLTSVDGGSYALNATLTVLAEDLLLGGEEGDSWLDVSGCFLPQGVAAPCADNGTTFSDLRVPLEVVDRSLRRDAHFLLSPDLVGLHPGTIEASVRVINVHASGTETQSAPQDHVVTVLPSRLDSVDPAGSSLGGYVDFLGAGFVGGAPDEGSEILVEGVFTPDDGGPDRTVSTYLVTAFDSGERARYVLDEQDSLGQIVDLRAESGTVSGTFTPRFAKGADSVTGSPVTGSFRIEPVRQVVYVNFTPAYRDALELFGLSAAEPWVRSRILEKAAWIYRGVNVMFQDTPPKDYLLYAEVDVSGFDPNGLGLMGYDNSPGKDVGNLRLYDRIGGVNAKTQEDGYPGFGGVFVESFLAFSEHPPAGIDPHPGATPLFDEIFDPLRPDRHGDPVSSEELAGFVPLSSGDGCPAPSGDRAAVIRCGVFVLGNLLGGTMAHELGHSLGLADPGGNRFHNSGEAPNRLMDSGGSRPFEERTELMGGGPEVFCQDNFEYLVSILPTGIADPIPDRPSCY